MIDLKQLYTDGECEGKVFLYQTKLWLRLGCMHGCWPFLHPFFLLLQNNTSCDLLSHGTIAALEQYANQEVPMEKLLKPFDKECMKLAMLKHEETFKEQVYELHRLYQIQKSLMENIENRVRNGQSQKRWDSKNGIGLIDHLHHHHHQEIKQKPRKKLDLEQPAEAYIAGSDGDHGMLEIDDECEIELTLGPSSYSRRKKADTPLSSDSGPSFSTSSTGSSHTRRTSPGTQQRTNSTAREELNGRDQWGLFQVSNSNPGFQSERTMNVDVEEQLRQERLKQSPWLFQVLSLNMT